MVDMENCVRFSTKRLAHKTLIMINLLASFGYNILDNIVWAVSIGLINKRFSNINLKWKSTKDVCSMIRAISNVFLSIVNTRRSRFK